MTIILRVAISVLLVLIGLVSLYVSAYAFSLNGTLRSVLQWAMVALTLIGVVFVWREQWVGAVAAVGGIAAVMALILFLDR